MSPFSRGLQFVASPSFPHGAIRLTVPVLQCGLRSQQFRYASSAVVKKTTRKSPPARPSTLRSLPRLESKPAPPSVDHYPQPPALPTEAQNPRDATFSVSEAPRHLEERVLFQVDKRDDLRMLITTRLFASVFILYPVGMITLFSGGSSLSEFSTWSQYGYYGIVAVMESIGLAYWSTTWNTVGKITALLPKGLAGGGRKQPEANTAILRIEGRGPIPFKKYAIEALALDVTKSVSLEYMQYEMFSMYQAKEDGHAPLSEVPAAVRPFAKMGRAFRRFYWSFRQGLMREGRVFLDLHGKEKGKWRIYPANGTLRTGLKGFDQLVQP